MGETKPRQLSSLSSIAYDDFRADFRELSTDRRVSTFPIWVAEANNLAEKNGQIFDGSTNVSYNHGIRFEHSDCSIGGRALKMGLAMEASGMEAEVEPRPPLSGWLYESETPRGLETMEWLR